MNKLTENQRFVKRAYSAYENDICIESILRSIKKLESGLSAVIGNDKTLINNSKLLYYSNSINFSNEQMREKCRAKNDFLQFLQGNYADKIWIKYHNKDHIDFEIEEFEMNHLIHDEKQEKGTLCVSQSEYMKNLKH